MAIKRVNIDVKQKPTKEQAEMIARAAAMPPIFDDDSPELSPEILSKFKKISEENNAERKKGVVTIRLSSSAIKKAKSLGKGYTSVLARIIEDALNDPGIIESHL